MFVRQAGGREGRDRERPLGEWPLRVPHPPFAHVRVHDQLYPQAQTPAREVHDEQRPRELHHSPGKRIKINKFPALNNSSRNIYIYTHENNDKEKQQIMG